SGCAGSGRTRAGTRSSSSGRSRHGPAGPPRLAGMAKRLIVKATAGSDAPERCSQAFTVAAAAVASGAEVSLWLTGESARFARRGRAAAFELPHAAPLPELLEAILAGGRVTVCTQCAARRDIGEDDVLEGVRIAGASTYIEEIL